MMDRLIEILTTTGCSLVVESHGEVSTYNKKGVRDLIWLLDNEPQRLIGTRVADKVVGKASAGLMARAGVRELYAQVLSRLAQPILDDAKIAYTYGTLVDRIVIPDGDTRCPLEKIVAPASTPAQVESLLREHFADMQRQRENT